MIRKRFPISRVAGIVGWTAAATAWTTLAIARVAPQPAVADQAAVDPPQTAAVTETGTTAAVPDLPSSGLVVIRYTPSPTPEPQVVTRVVQQRVVVQQAPRPASQGS